MVMTEKQLAFQDRNRQLAIEARAAAKLERQSMPEVDLCLCEPPGRVFRKKDDPRDGRITRRLVTRYNRREGG